MSKMKAITKEEIRAKKEALKEKIAISKSEVGVVRASPATDFLNEISDLIKDALSNKVSYKQLSKDIFSVYSFKVSEQTIRLFAQNVLGVPKRKKIKRATAPVEDKVVTPQVIGDRLKSDFDD